jgi:hypothetical protein
MFIHLVWYLSNIRERRTYWLTILSFSLIPAAGSPDMETWIAFSLNNSGAELSISKQKDRKIEREGVCRWFRFAQLAKGKKFRP